MHFNLSKMNKTSGADDFVGGYVGNTLDSLPPQDELSEEQIRYIRDMSLSRDSSHVSSSDKIKFYVRYPNYYYYHLHDLEQYFRYYGNDEIFQQAWRIYLSGPGNSFYIPTRMSTQCVQDILDTNKVSSDDAASFFITEKRMDRDPVSFLGIVAEKFPEEYKRVFGEGESYIASDIKTFLENPTDDNKGKLKSSLQSLDHDDPNDMEILKKLKSNFITNGNLYSETKSKDQRHTYSDGSSLLSQVDQALEAVQNKESLDDPENPFIIRFVQDPLIGDVAMLYYDEYMMDMSALSILKNNIEPDKYYEVSLPTYSRPQDYPELNLDDHTVYLMEDEKAIELSKLHVLSYDYSPMKEIDKLLYVDAKSNSSMMVEYVKNLFEKNRPEVAFNELMKNQFFKSFMDSANDDLWGAYVNNYEVLPEGSTSRDFSKVLPYNMRSAFEIWTIIPEQFRHIKEYGFFYMCSGFFPCSEIYEKAKSDLKWAVKITDHILGSCSKDENMKLRKQIILDYDKMETISRKTFDENIDAFLKSDAVQKKSISDFPKLEEYSIEFLNRNLTNEESYDYNSGGMVSSVSRAIKNVASTPIYLINSKAMTRQFGDDVLRYLKFSPEECGGFYSTYFAGSKAIVVYVDKAGGDLNKVLGEIIGLNEYSEDSSLNVETESTLWHETAHALSKELVQGPSEKQDTMAEWMSSTDEILAMTYGNLQYIKNKLREFFKEQFPFNKSIESGFLNEIKSGVISSFPMEFSGSNKEEALKRVSDAMPEFDNDVLDMLNNMTKKEKIEYLVNMFTEYFMGKFFRNKVEDHFFGKDKEEKMDFKEERVVPEEDAPFVAGQKDRFLKELSGRQDYQEFINASREYVKNNYLHNDNLSRFTHRTYKDSLITPTKLSEVLMMIFDLKGSITSTDLSRQGVFYNMAPPSLIKDLQNIVKQETEIEQSKPQQTPEPQVPSPDEAEETGRFMAEQDEAYGPDWMWLANGKSWYKKSKIHHTFLVKQSSDVLTLYHGTSNTNAEKIKVEGLKHNNLGAGWYTLADNFEDAKAHSHTGSDESVVIEFKIPNVTEGPANLNPWIWNAEEVSNGHWYALRKDLPSNFVTNIHKVSHEDN